MEVRSAGRPSVGASNETWLFDASWDAAGGRRHEESWVLRLAPAEASLFPRYDLAREYRALAALQGASLKVPMPRRYEADIAVLGRPFFLMARFGGRVIQENPLYHLEGWFHDLDAPAQAAHWHAFIDGLGQLHRVDWQARGLGFLDAPVSGGQAGAENGVLTVMCGGEPAHFDAVAPIIDAYARACTLLGPTGSGQLTKMVNQLAIAGVVQGLAEAVASPVIGSVDVFDANTPPGQSSLTKTWCENRSRLR